MKKKTFAYAILGLLFLAACKKFDWDGPIPPGANEKDYLLKKVIHGARTYTFYFNKKKTLDSIGVDDLKEKGVYKVFRRNNRLDSVVYLSNGSPRWYHNYLQYDSAGNLTGYLTSEVPAGAFPEPTMLTYQQGQLRSITTFPPMFFDRYDTLTWNQQHDITRWSTNMPRSIDLDVRLFTYDSRYNPLYFIDDLLVILSRSTISREFVLSQHNSTVVFHQLFNSTVNYQNTYDKKQRLTKKVFAGRFGSPVDSLLFQYQR